MPKGDNQVNLRANLDFKRMLISMHKTKVVETIMVMKKKMVRQVAPRCSYELQKNLHQELQVQVFRCFYMPK